MGGYRFVRNVLPCAALVLLAPLWTQGQVLVDHTCTDVDSIPNAWIAQAASDLHIAYNHTSHGSQLISGMNALEDYPPYGSKFVWEDNGSVGLDLDDKGIPCSASDLSQGDYEVNDEHDTPWVLCTRNFLDNPDNSHINVIMWSWCSIRTHDAQLYVDNMEKLVAEYPAVDFVFMTGHAEGHGEDLTEDGVHFNNELIREHCRDNNRILYDFADIEAFDPDGTYFWDLDMYDNLDYTFEIPRDSNWASQWIAANPGSDLEQLTLGDGDTYYGVNSCAHSDWPSESKLNCALKGSAAWWLFATLAGWTEEPIFEDGFEDGSLSNWSL